ncbi:flagellar basal body-associated FliL family protein [Amphibiibacter pelophylacis]|uniref:Flagellar basal body-associated FliL family protein n=1 Tax=Amphibiibacter pelophylacis TaxID=1799477 RepID=A0ACC6P321_9BURK
MSATPAPAAAETDAPAKAKGGKKKLILLIVLVLVLLGGAGGGYFYWTQLQKAKHAQAGEEGGEAAAESHDSEAPKAPIYMPLDPFVANLNDKDSEKMAQIGVVLELKDAKDEATVKSFMPSVRNNVIMLIASKTSDELQTFDGKQKLAEEIRRAALAPMGNRLETAREKKDAPVRGVQFSSFIIQ